MSNSKVINTISDLIEYLIDTYKINHIPSTRSSREDLERHFGHCEVIQRIIEVSGTSELSMREVAKVSPLDFQKEAPEEILADSYEDPIDVLLKKKGLFTNDNE